MGVETGAFFDGADLPPAMLGQPSYEPDTLLLLETVTTDEGCIRALARGTDCAHRGYFSIIEPVPINGRI